MSRHQHRGSQVLHAIGIPLAIAAVVLAIVQLINWQWSLWYRPVILLVVGYFMQWVGHRLEGNDMGELILIKKWLNRPYVAVSPRYASSDASVNSSEHASLEE
jgi:MFS superfamily sulfate permease-like transporter